MADFKVPQVDFSWLGQLPAEYELGKKSAQQRGLSEDLANFSLTTPEGTQDFPGLAKILAKHGFVKEAAEMMTTQQGVYGNPIYYQKPDGTVGVAAIGKAGGLIPLNMGQPQTAGQTPVVGAQSPTGAQPQPLQGMRLQQQVTTETQKAQAQPQAKARLSDALGGLTQDYMALDKAGAIVRPGAGVGRNIGAYLQSTGVGQEVAGAVGSQAQSIRQRINNTIPLLIAQVRQASGMSARGLDSNVELKFYMQMATDPHRDIISNLAAIDLLDRAFGMGGSLDKAGLPPDLMKQVRANADQMWQSKPITITPDQLEGAGQDQPLDVPPVPGAINGPVTNDPAGSIFNRPPQLGTPEPPPAPSGGIVDYKTYFGQ